MMNDLAFAAGLEQAAALLERTAADYDQMAEQKRRVADRGARAGRPLVHVDRAKAAEYANKADLLRGQAKLIRQIET
ncbi:hypothetical protein D3C87_847950 [compost metagenome]